MMESSTRFQPASMGTTKGVEMSFDAGEEIGKFAFTATVEEDVLHAGQYDRWIGSFTGGLVGGEELNETGFALWETMGPIAISE